MSNRELAFAISTPIAVTLLFVLFAFLMIKYYSAREVSWKGMKLFKLDLYSRKVMISNYSKKHKHLLKGIKKDEWINLKSITRQFVGNDDVEKLFRDALERIGRKKERFTFDFISNVALNSKRQFYKFEVSFSPKEDESDFIMRISWKAITKEHKLAKSNVKYVSKEDIISYPAATKGFVAFNLNHEIQSASTKLISILSQMSNKDLIYFRNNDVLIVSFFGSTPKNVNKQINAFVQKVKIQGLQRGANSFFRGSGYLTLNGVSSNKSLNQVLRAIDFFIILSIDLNKNFISNQDESFNNEEYQKYSNGSKVFRAAVRTGDLNTELIPVRSRKGRKVVINYANPKINGLNDNMLGTLLTNRNNKTELINSQAKLVGIKSTMNKPILVDVNSDWLIENHKKLKFKKAIYVINLRRGTKYGDLKTVIKNLSGNGFFFAIRIVNFSEMVAALIKQTAPQFILIDSAAWNEHGVANSTSYISLLSIKKIAKAEKIMVIFENPSKLVDDRMADKIGLKFYYNI